MRSLITAACAYAILATSCSTVRSLRCGFGSGPCDHREYVPAAPGVYEVRRESRGRVTEIVVEPVPDTAVVVQHVGIRVPCAPAIYVTKVAAQPGIDSISVEALQPCGCPDRSPDRS